MFRWNYDASTGEKSLAFHRELLLLAEVRQKIIRDDGWPSITSVSPHLTKNWILDSRLLDLQTSDWQGIQLRQAVQ